MLNALALSVAEREQVVDALTSQLRRQVQELAEQVRGVAADKVQELAEQVGGWLRDKVQELAEQVGVWLRDKVQELAEQVGGVAAGRGGRRGGMS